MNVKRRSCADLIYFQSGLTVIIMSERYQKHNRPLAAVIPYQSCAGEFTETFHKFHILSAFPNFLFPSCYSTIVFFIPERVATSQYLSVESSGMLPWQIQMFQNTTLKMMLSVVYICLPSTCDCN